MNLDSPAPRPARRPASGRPRVVCLGNMTIDDVVLPDGQTVMGRCGGDTLYSGFGALIWLDEVALAAPVGNDFPAHHLDYLREAGFDLSAFPRRPAPGIRNWVLNEYDGRRRFVLRSRPEDFLTLSPSLADIPAAWQTAEGIHIAAMELEAQEELAAGLRGRAGVVTLDPRLEYIPGNEPRILQLAGAVDIFLPSHVEAEALVGHTDHWRAARELAAHGCRVVVVKQGEAGSLVYDAAGSRAWKVPAFPTRATDPTGAGDAYCGGFLAMYVLTRDLPRAAAAGAVSASFAIEAYEPFHLLAVSREEAQGRLEKLFAQVTEVQG